MAQSQGMSKSRALYSNGPAYDCPSFSNLLKSVLGTKSSAVRFQGQYETSQQDTVMSTKPKVTGAQLELEVKCANHSTSISPLAPAEISEPHSAPAMSKQSLMLHKDLPGQVLDQQNSDHPASLSHAVVEMPAADGYSWRKYGQKQVKGSKSSRSYYKCSNSNCRAKKKVQRCDHSGRIIDVIYIGHHNHDHPQNKCNLSGGSLPSAKLSAGSLVDSVQKEDGVDMSTCWGYIRQSSVHMAESEEQSSCSSDGNIGIKVEEQNNNELESKKLEVRHQKTNSRGFASAEVQERGAEPRPMKRMKERSAYSDSVFEANKETKIVVHATADGGISSDGYLWRKYGQKMVKGNSQLRLKVRSYYRCTTAGCPSRKQVERAVDDATTATITYEGKHDHDMPVPKRQKGSESLARISSAAVANGGDQCKKTKSLSSCPRISNKWSFYREGNLMDEVLELGGEKALESAQTLLSIGIELRPC